MRANEAELLEVFRLAEAAGAEGIVRESGDLLLGRWMAVSRFQKVVELSSRLLQIQISAGTLLAAGRAASELGDPAVALGYFERALTLVREAGDRAGEGTVLNNIGGVHHARGEHGAALDYYGQALTLRREVGDRAGEATTLNDVGLVHYERGEHDAALDYYGQALPLMREVGARAGEAATLNNIGMVHADRGDGVAAMGYYGPALALRREVGDRRGEAVTRYNIAGVHRAAGRFAEAVGELEQVVALDRAVQHPDLESDTAVLKQVRAAPAAGQQGQNPDQGGEVSS